MHWKAPLRRGKLPKLRAQSPTGRASQGSTGLRTGEYLTIRAHSDDWLQNSMTIVHYISLTKSIVLQPMNNKDATHSFENLQKNIYARIIYNMWVKSHCTTMS